MLLSLCSGSKVKGRPCWTVDVNRLGFLAAVPVVATEGIKHHWWFGEAAGAAAENWVQLQWSAAPPGGAATCTCVCVFMYRKQQMG